MNKKYVIRLIIILLCVYIGLVLVDRICIQKPYKPKYLYGKYLYYGTQLSPNRITFPTEIETLLVPNGTDHVTAYTILGKPQRSSGSGFQYFEWDLQSGNVFRAAVIPGDGALRIYYRSIRPGTISHRQLIVPGILCLTALGYIAIVRHNQRTDKAGKRLEDALKDS